MDREDGEMSDDEPMAIDDDKKTITVPDTELTVVRIIYCSCTY